ncbi:MAG: hypothetical protein EBQ92_08595 [Proteobacteria bacterium]|nr:hypothetical protein [Pseudomonadota bacterium]
MRPIIESGMTALLKGINPYAVAYQVEAKKGKRGAKAKKAGGARVCVSSRVPCLVALCLLGGPLPGGPPPCAHTPSPPRCALALCVV